MTIPMPDPMVEVDKQSVSPELQYTYLAPSGGLEHGTYLITTSQAEAYAAAKVRESQEWQPIETAPMDGTEIIGWNGRVVTAIAYLSEKDDNGHTGWCQSGYTDGGMLYYFHNALSADEQPTHWKPLPPPPTE